MGHKPYTIEATMMAVVAEEEGVGCCVNIGRGRVTELLRGCGRQGSDARHQATPMTTTTATKTSADDVVDKLERKPAKRNAEKPINFIYIYTVGPIYRVRHDVQVESCCLLVLIPAPASRVCTLERERKGLSAAVKSSEHFPAGLYTALSNSPIYIYKPTLVHFSDVKSRRLLPLQ